MLFSIDVDWSFFRQNNCGVINRKRKEIADSQKFVGNRWAEIGRLSGESGQV
jgi:hypothetical protein